MWQRFWHIGLKYHELPFIDKWQVLQNDSDTQQPSLGNKNINQIIYSMHKSSGKIQGILCHIQNSIWGLSFSTVCLTKCKTYTSEIRPSHVGKIH